MEYQLIIWSQISICCQWIGSDTWIYIINYEHFALHQELYFLISEALDMVPHKIYSFLEYQIKPSQIGSVRWKSPYTF